MATSPPQEIFLPTSGLPLSKLGMMDEPTAPNNPPSQSTEAMKDVAFGSLAGSIGKIIEYPFDTVKVRLQSQSLSLPIYSGPLDCFRQSIRADGVFRGLYRGISAPIVGAAIETSSLFFSYRIAQDFWRSAISKTRHDPAVSRSDLSMPALTACGAMSGAFTSLLLTPIELVKCQMQVPLEAGSSRGPGPLSIIGKVFRHHGILGFWHGQLGTLIRETGGSAAWFGSYEGTSAMFRRYNAPYDWTHASSTLTPGGFERQSSLQLPIYQQLLAGASAGVMYNFVFFPADTIKSRMQTEDVGSSRAPLPKPLSKSASPVSDLPAKGTSPSLLNTASPSRQTFWAAGKALWRQQGLAGMYRGCGITVARSAPSSAFIFAIYEGLKGWWG